MKGSKGQSQAGGESGKQLDQESGAGDSVLVSVHVELDFANEAWLLALSRTPTLPTALASSPSRTLTSLSLMTVPRTLLLNSWLQMPGNTLNLTFLTSHETTDLNWLLWHTGNRSPVLLQPGSRVSLTSHPGQVVLSIFNISHEWAGEYQCYFEAQGFRWELYYVVRVPLETTDVAWLPDQLFISCATSPGFQLRCCVPSTHPTYVVSWIWRRQQRSGEGPVLGGQELVFQLTGHRMQFTLESGA
ncbi:adhesion G-protein coupled receptor F3-like isoform X3 [Manis javanica]|uniref:adhesion G-protein coupled receptor F3-like isoform X3 n=1 Tax=Manis javanica TaxID=9974 RepID=UPI003C6D713E